MRNRGFTLLEVVLAIGLAGAVIGLLTTAINLFLVRVDASRTQVESAQLARTLLNQIAADLRAARYFSPSASTSGDDAESEDSADPSSVQGIFGTATELRIDRSAAWQWEYQARYLDVTIADIEPDPSPVQDAMPQTVRYLLGEGKELLASKLAATGVSEEPLSTGYSGLYRAQLSTAAWLEQISTSESDPIGGDLEAAELIAPEVVAIAFAYFDGEELLDEWDSSLGEGLPEAVEIRLTLLKEPFEQASARSLSDRNELRRNKENLVEYRRFVKLSDILEPNEAEFPQQGGTSSDTPGFGSSR